ncbi:coronin [Trypanosoma grayi]|uniref:coronin n=1 Tax=Trypanosoma grayi TaxID=71804 RepID=UPI0004F4422E|nr:coronin [Trypanosoma grayi]KEG09412.1 coronin [Trypanosoma grayi]
MAISRFRHTQSVPSRLDKQFLNVSPTGAIWDCSNMMACSDRFLAVPWAQLGSTAVLRHTDYGKVAANPPILLGQEGPIIDVAFNPFDSTKLFTASEDGTIMGWCIPEEGLTENCSDHTVHLHGHSKKVGIINFHPSAANVLASAGADMVVNVWDVSCGKAGEVLKCHTDQIMSLDWNLDGSLLCSTSKDKKVNIMDPRKGDIVASGSAHQSGKTQRCLWAKRPNLIMTTGFNKAQARQVMVWDARNMTAPAQTEDIDQSSSVMLPFFDEDTNLLYIASRGEGGIRFYELMDGRLVNCSAYTSSEVHKGLCIFPKWSLDTRQCEIARFCALTPKSIYTIQMLLPRRQADVELQMDVYPPTFADKPALTAEQYFNGENSEPLVTGMQAVFDGTEREVKTALEMTPGMRTQGGTTPARSQNFTPTPARSQHVQPTPAHSQQVNPTPARAHLFGTTPARHIDPMAMEPSQRVSEVKNHEKDTEKLMIQLKALTSQLERQKQEAEKCRDEMEKKLRLVMETVDEIVSITSRISS